MKRTKIKEKGAGIGPYYKNLTATMTIHLQAGLGFIATLVINFNLNVFGKSLVEGTKTTLHCCVADDVKNVGGGKYFVDAKPVDIFPWLVNDRKEEMLWTKSEKLVGLTP